MMTNALREKYNRIMAYIRSRSQEQHSNVSAQLMKTAELSDLKVYYRDIASLMSEGYLEKIRQGYYRVVLSDNAGNNQDEAALIAALYPDGVLCMDTALFYYHYSDRTPLAWDIAVDKDTSKSRFVLDYPLVQPYYMESAHLRYGVTLADFDGYTLKIFDRDRLICECIRNEKKMDAESYRKAIRGYTDDSKKSIANLLGYANKRGMLRKVKERIGVWL